MAQDPRERDDEPAKAQDAPTPEPLTEQETKRLDRKIGEETRRQAEVGQTVRGSGG